MQKALFSVLTVQSITQRHEEADGLLFDLRLEHPQWSSFKPGQFAMLRPEGWALDMPWARPLSISALSSDALHFLFQVAGRGTDHRESGTSQRASVFADRSHHQRTAFAIAHGQGR